MSKCLQCCVPLAARAAPLHNTSFSLISLNVLFEFTPVHYTVTQSKALKPVTSLSLQRGGGGWGGGEREGGIEVGEKREIDE